MVDRRMSLKTLFIFTTLLAICLACVTRVPQGEYLHQFGQIGLVGLPVAAIGFLLRGRLGMRIGLVMLLVAAFLIVVIGIVQQAIR